MFGTLAAIPLLYLLIAQVIFMIILMLGAHMYTFQLAELPTTDKAFTLSRPLFTYDETGKVVAKSIYMVNGGAIAASLGALGILAVSYIMLLKGGSSNPMAFV